MANRYRAVTDEVRRMTGAARRVAVDAGRRVAVPFAPAGRTRGRTPSSRGPRSGVSWWRPG